jgi:transcriptional repressor NrdR
MRCPYCQQDNDRVVDSRTSQEGRAVRRRRECIACGRRFTTYEVIEERQLQVAKRDGSTEPYDRRKVVQAIQLSCAKRPVTPVEIETMADEIEDALGKLGRDDVDSRTVGELIMDRLKARDHVAYVRFASVYRNFQDLDEFYEELRDLSARRARAAMNESQVELPLYDTK